MPKRRVFESVGVRELEHDDFAEDPYGGMQTQWGSKIEDDPTVCEVWRELTKDEVEAEEVAMRRVSEMESERASFRHFVIESSRLQPRLC